LQPDASGVKSSASLQIAQIDHVVDRARCGGLAVRSIKNRETVGRDETFATAPLRDQPGVGLLFPPIPCGADAAMRHALWKSWRATIERSGWHSTRKGCRRAWTVKRRLFFAAMDAFRFGSHLAGQFGRGQRNILDVQIRRVEVPIAGLPIKLDGYRILQVTDLHLGGVPGIATAVIAAVRDCGAVDALVLSGDHHYATRCRWDKPRSVAEIADIIAAVSPTDGVFAVLGNHDCLCMVDDLKRAGAVVLCNESRSISRDGATLVLTGVDDVHYYYTPLADAAFAETKLPGPNRVGIALVHSPEMIDVAAGHGYSFYLCGHTHGGQVCMPGGQPFYVGVGRENRPFARGLWRFGAMTGFTGDGVGGSGAPLRFHSKGSVVVLTLRSQDQDPTGR
jgi:predicted MPP superfamily phosphohydrolase